MTAPLQFEHPHALRFMPRRARHERLAVATAVTPARLIEADASDMVEAGSVGGIRAYAHGGRLWGRMETVQSGPGLAEFVRGELRDPTGLTPGISRDRAMIARSPLLAWRRDWDGRLSDPPGGNPHACVRDHSERASADLLSFLDGSVRLAGGHAYVRLRGPLMLRHVRADCAERGPFARPHGLYATQESWARGHACELWSGTDRDSAVGFWEAEDRPPHPWEPGTAKAEVSRDCLALADPDAGILHFLNTAPAAVILHSRVYTSPEAVAAVAPWAEIGMLGAIRRDEAHDVMDAVERGCAAAQEARERLGGGTSLSLDHLVSFARQVVRPAVEATPGIEDAEALDAIGPGF